MLEEILFVLIVLVVIIVLFRFGLKQKERDQKEFDNYFKSRR